MPVGAPLGNTNSAKAKPWQKALERALARHGGDVDSGLNPLAEKVLKLALDGDKDAWQEIANRLDGKPAQQLIHSGDSESPLTITIKRFTEGTGA